MVNVVLFCSLQCYIHDNIQKNNKISPPISQTIHFFKIKIYLFILWLCGVLVAVWVFPYLQRVGAAL